MDRSDFFANHLYDEALRLDAKYADGCVAPAEESARKVAAQAVMVTSGSREQRDSAFEKGLGRPIDRRTPTIGQLPLMDLKCLLFSLGRKQFAPHSLKALRDKDEQRGCTKEACLRVLEYLTKLGPDFTLDGTCFRIMGDLCDHAALCRQELPGRIDVMN